MLLQNERERPGAWRLYRPVLQQAAAGGGAAADEAILWFALSACEASLRDATVALSSPAERAELKDDLQSMLLGTLPPSVRGKALQVLAQVARATWPAEQPALLHSFISLLAQPGAPRALGARLLSAVVDEFSPSAHRGASAGASIYSRLVASRLARCRLMAAGACRQWRGGRRRPTVSVPCTRSRPVGTRREISPSCGTPRSSLRDQISEAACWRRIRRAAAHVEAAGHVVSRRGFD